MPAKKKVKQKKSAAVPAGAISRWLDIAKGLLSQPAAACKEECPQAFIRQFAAKRKNLKLTADAAGNLLLKYGSPSAKRPLVMVAHLDHPGFWVGARDGSSIELIFKGGVASKHVRKGARVQFFARGNPEAIGAGELLEVREEKERLTGALAKITHGNAQEHGYAMWEFPGFSVANDSIVTRCCDDLLGASAALSVLDEISRRKPKGVSVWGLFTRSEEIGFLGTLEAIRLKTLPKTACVLSLECSNAANGIAEPGGGVIVRVGDKSSIFDPNLSQALRQAAEAVKKEIPSFKYQRRLMDGGTCEATPFCAAGYRASGLALPLLNYHNQSTGADGKPDIGPEMVKIDDYLSEVQLLTELALRPELLDAKPAAPTWVKELQALARVELYAR